MESEVKKRKGLEIDKTRLEREIMELQRRADRERIKREELETRWGENGEVSAPRSAQISPTSPASNALTRFVFFNVVYFCFKLSLTLRADLKVVVMEFSTKLLEMQKTMLLRRD